THRCYIGGSRMVELGDRMLRCTRCGLEIDRDVNGAVNIALKAMSNQGFPRGTGAFVDMPELRMSWPQKPASAEAPSLRAG
ncbi:MAG: transposase, partial [Hadesarchaea archaeon]|nr:transposase [Hadesarchaea archaeon]